MSETYTLSLNLHTNFVKLLLIFLVVHIFLVFTGDTKKFNYIKRLMYFLPAYYTLMAFIFFTGILNLAIVQFSGVNLGVIFMVVCWILLIPLGAAGFKRLKTVRLDKNFRVFKRFMLVKIVCEIFIVVVGIVAGVLL